MSGYVHCACRDCFEIAIGDPGALCHECRAAGCEPVCMCGRLACPHSRVRDLCTCCNRWIGGRGCCRPDAYGDDPSDGVDAPACTADEAGSESDEPAPSSRAASKNPPGGTGGTP